MRESAPAANDGADRKSKHQNDALNAAGSVMDKLIAAAVDRVLNPPRPARWAGMAAELERTLPLLTPFITEVIDSWGRISEARRAIRHARADSGKLGSTTEPNSARPGNQAGSSV